MKIKKEALEKYRDKKWGTYKFPDVIEVEDEMIVSDEETLKSPVTYCGEKHSPEKIENK